MTRCVIIDDEPLAIKLLSSYLEKIDDFELIESFSNPLKALSYLNNNSVDLVFLDIQMPEINGVQLAKVLADQLKIIFTTAYPNYAVDGFELKALDYLLKPISFHRFLDAVNRYEIKKLDTKPLVENSTDFIFVKTENRLQKIKLDEIYFLKGMGDYCAIITDDSKVMTLENMKSFEAKLPTDKFIRVHKSYIVSINKIKYIEKNRISIKEELIPISASYDKAFKKYLSQM